jgi:hypothetical protein
MWSCRQQVRHFVCTHLTIALTQLSNNPLVALGQLSERCGRLEDIVRRCLVSVCLWDTSALRRWKRLCCRWQGRSMLGGFT